MYPHVTQFPENRRELRREARLRREIATVRAAQKAELRRCRPSLAARLAAVLRPRTRPALVQDGC
jgi:hypothetical protein